MIAIIVISHGSLAEALVTPACGLLGQQEGVVALGLGSEESPESLAERLQATIDSMTLREALILTDLNGGTPQRVATGLAHTRVLHDCAVVSGANLGMLCEALVLREAKGSLTELAECAARVGAEQVRCWVRHDASE